MQIGIVIDEFDSARGGMEAWCRQLIAALAQRGHGVHLVTQRVGEKTLPEGVRPHLVPRASGRTDFAHRAAARLRHLELDVVHDMGAGWCCDIFQPHGGSHFAWLARRLEMYPAWFRYAKRAADALLPRSRDFLQHARRQFSPRDAPGKTFVALSHAVADDFTRLHALRPEQIAVVPNGVDCQRFSPAHRATYRDEVRRQLRADDEATLLLLAAHNFRLKGLPELLHVAARLASNRRRVQVAVVGGKRLAKWRRAAARLGLAERVTFVGAVDDPRPYYAAADVYVHPTYYDPCSLVILEAAASGLPIVTTRRHNGAAELFRDGQEILLADNPRDADRLYQLVDALCNEPFRRRLGAAAREVALRHPFERNVTELLRLYERSIRHRLAA